MAKFRIIKEIYDHRGEFSFYIEKKTIFGWMELSETHFCGSFEPDGITTRRNFDTYEEAENYVLSNFRTPRKIVYKVLDV